MNELPMYQAILLSVQGVLTSATYTTKTLVPYGQQHLAAYLEKSWRNKEVQRDIEALRQQSERDRQSGRMDFVNIPQEGPSAIRAAAVQYVRSILRSADRTVPAVDSLMGKVWSQGWKKGSLVGEVLADVQSSFSRWQELGVPVATYDKWSVSTQKVLLSHTRAGDLTPYVSHWFDEPSGNKSQPPTYARLLEQWQRPPNRVLYLTSEVSEAHAARNAGLQVMLFSRMGIFGKITHDLPMETSLTKILPPKKAGVPT